MWQSVRRVEKKLNWYWKFSIIILICLSAIVPCKARIIYVDANATGLNNGSNWANAYNYLQNALADANTNRDINEILVAQGTYKPDANSTKPKGTSNRAASFYLIDGVSIKGGYAGNGKENPNDRNIEAYVTILTGDIGTPGSDKDNSYHVVDGEGVSMAAIDGLTIADGNADGPYPYGYRGGGMFFQLGSLTAENCTFKNNHGYDGGAVYKIWKSDFVMKNCTFIGNSSSSEGGGIFNGYGSLTLLNCVFIENSARNNGGGVHNDWSGESKIYNCTFTRNTSGGFGGGLFNGENFETVVTNCSFTDNKASRGGGMGTEGSGDTNTSVIKCDFMANSAIEDGGALNLFGGRGLFLFNDCNFKGNIAGRFGGGIYNQSNNPVLNNCIISGNSSDQDGGGIYNYSSHVILNNCIIRNNTTKGKGGGMCSTYMRNQKLKDCDVSFNFAANGGGIYSDNGYAIDLNDCSIIDNAAAYDGGGVYIYNNVNGTAVISDCRFEKNDANRYGGGLYNSYYSNSNIGNSLFICNSAKYGGGIDNYLSNPNVIGCTFTGNTAYSDGGGLRNNGPCNTLMSSCVFTGNKAAGSGGAIHSISGSKPFFSSCTFSGNRATKGGALSSERSSNPIVTNCILWNNAASLGNNICLSSYTWMGRTEVTSMTVDYTDTESGSEWILVETGCTLNWKEGNIEVDPCFVQEGVWDINAVWIDGDCHLSDSSFCIDAGDPNYLPAAGETDLDGVPRVIGGRIDMGAYEFNYQPISVAGPNQVAYAWIDGIAEVTLDGSGSYDEDGNELTYLWRWSIDGNDYEVNGVSPSIELPVGMHTIELVVNDGWKDSEPNYVDINVIGPVEANLCVMPKVLNSKSFMPKIMTTLRLPKGITNDQIDANVPLLLYPGQIEADRVWINRCFDYKCRAWNTTILAWFDKK